MSRGLPGPPLDPKASLESNACRILAVRIEELFSYAPIISDSDATEALHDARIATKRLRYTLELFRSVFQEEGDHAIEQLKDLQEDLGQLHDHDVRIALVEEKLASLARRTKTESHALRPGLEALLERDRVARAACHDAVGARWRQLEREKLQATLTDLCRPSSPENG